MKPDPILSIADGPRRLAGYSHGLRQPSLMVALQLRDGAETASRRLDEFLAGELGALDQMDLPPDQTSLLGRLLGWTDALLVKAGHPVLERPLVSKASGRQAGLHVVVHPCHDAQCCALAMKLMIALFNDFSQGVDLADPERMEQLRAQLNEFIETTAHRSPSGFNSAHFIKAAFELGAPLLHVAPGVVQFGWGANSRWLSSSFTDHTSRISAHLARDKRMSAEVLRAAGLPVPPHATAASAEEAVRIAESLGYPVVVKPADLDGGVGVHADLRSEQAVRSAFDAALAHSKSLLVEKHVHGRDFRIQVVEGQVQGVLERVPGGVTGDGVQSVESLLDQQNLERRIATDDRRYLKQMVLDDDARQRLREQGLSSADVPAAGRFVRLRAAANVASGGIPVLVDPGQVHPHNLELAQRAAGALRLDVAGIDLLTPDIGKSWMDGGAAICEVNAQPQMFSTLHKPMLQRLLNSGNGRIPAVVVLGADALHDVGKELYQRWISFGRATGLVHAEGIWSGTQLVLTGAHSVHRGGTLLIRDQSVDALILSVADDGVLATGWPIDRCDVLVLAGTGVRASIAPSDARALAAVVDSTLGLRPRRIVVDAQTAQDLEQAGVRLPGQDRVSIVTSARENPARWLESVVKAVEQVVEAGS